MPRTQGHGNPDWSRDETLLALDLVLRTAPSLPGKRSKEVLELSGVLRRLPTHAGAPKNETFRNADGVYLKLQNLLSLHPAKADRKGLNTSRMDRRVWSDYAERPEMVSQLAAQIRQGIVLLEQPEIAAGEPDDLEAAEGGVLLRVHKVRERSRGFRPRVISRARKQHGQARCESCGCGPAGWLPEPFCLAMFEVHHIVPLSEVATALTRLPDLVLLCANCHRLIHGMMRWTEGPVGLADLQQRLRGMGQAP